MPHVVSWVQDNVDSVNHVMYIFISCSGAHRSRQTIKAPCGGLVKCLAARNLVPNFSSSCRISTGKTFQFNKKPLIYKLPQGTIYNHPARSLLKKKNLFAKHQVFVLSITPSDQTSLLTKNIFMRKSFLPGNREGTTSASRVRKMACR